MTDFQEDLTVGARATRVVERLLGLHPQIRQIRLLEYHYIPQALDDSTQVERWLNADTARRDGLGPALAEREKPGWDVAVYSGVRVDQGRHRHIPMMDFRAGHGTQELSDLRHLWRGIVDRPGYLLGTDNSYHWYGTDLLTHTQWVKFMGRALLCNRDGKEFVDVRYVGHRLFSGYGSLRLVGNRQRGTSDPTVLEVW